MITIFPCFQYSFNTRYVIPPPLCGLHSNQYTSEIESSGAWLSVATALQPLQHLFSKIRITFVPASSVPLADDILTCRKLKMGITGDFPQCYSFGSSKVTSKFHRHSLGVRQDRASFESAFKKRPINLKQSGAVQFRSHPGELLILIPDFNVAGQCNFNLSRASS